MLCDNKELYRLELLLVRNKDDGHRALTLPLQMHDMTTGAWHNLVSEICCRLYRL